MTKSTVEIYAATSRVYLPGGMERISGRTDEKGMLPVYEQFKKLSPEEQREWEIKIFRKEPAQSKRL